MRWAVLAFAFGCGPPPAGPRDVAVPQELAPPPTIDMANAGTIVDRTIDFAFDGGHIDVEMRRDGDHVYEVAHNHYGVPVVVQWELAQLDNLEPLSPAAGVTRLPAAARPNAEGPPVVLAQLQIVNPQASYRRVVLLHERFGDLQVQPQPYAYRLPYRRGNAFSVLQGFHGTFSHRGANEYAVDFDCPVATPVLAARPGVVVAANAAAQGSGTTPDFLEYKRTNFVLVLHDDGTLGEYMHLSPSGVEVTPGQRVTRGQQLALSGNTGFSSTPHLHFRLMAADESFPFRLAIGPDRVEEPVQGRTYLSWE